MPHRTIDKQRTIIFKKNIDLDTILCWLHKQNPIILDGFSPVLSVVFPQIYATNARSIITYIVNQYVTDYHCIFNEKYT